MQKFKKIRGTQINKLNASKPIKPDSMSSVYRDVENMSISEYLTATCAQGQAVELRVLTGKRALSGVFDDYDKLQTAALAFSGKAKAVYYTPNPIGTEPLNVMGKVKATADRDVMSRRWLLLDFDPCRATNTSSTDEELEAARIRAHAVRDYLSDKEWPLPLENMSGNGYHLMYRIDLPAEDKLVPQVLKHLSKLFSDDSVDVDEKVGNPARIWKLPGTLTCKGEDTADRPHRMATIRAMPAELAIVPQEALAELVGAGSAVKAHTSDFDLADFVKRHLPQAIPKERSYARLFYSIPVCPFNSEHDRGEAYVQQFPSGAVSAGCHHNSCKWKWGDLWRKLEGVKHSPKTPPATGRDNSCGWGARTGLTDLGNAEALVRAHGQDIRYDVDRRVWLCWDGTKWVSDETKVQAFAEQTILGMYEQLPAIDDVRARTELFKHIVRSESDPRISAMVNRARSQAEVAIHSEQFDVDKYLLNCVNGTLDLISGALKPHCREDYLSRVTRVAYKPNAKCPKWDSFLNQITRGDKAVVHYLQRWAGYCLCGSNREHKLLILYGKGRNGKGVWVNCLMHILSEYAGRASVASFTSSNKVDTNRHDLASLVGKRLVKVEEGEERQKLAEGLIKEITGGGLITCRKLYENNIEYEPEFKLIFPTNDVPRISSQGVALKERIRVVPFSRQYGGEGATDKPNKNLEDELLAEAEGILAWCVRGFAMWQAEGLEDEPQAVIEATRDMFFGDDRLGLWIEAKCSTPGNYECSLARLWDDYTQYCADEGLDREHRTRRTFSRDLLSRGGITKARNNAGVVLVGIGLNADYDVDAEDRDLAAEELAQEDSEQTSYLFAHRNN